MALLESYIKQKTEGNLQNGGVSNHSDPDKPDKNDSPEKTWKAFLEVVNQNFGVGKTLAENQDTTQNVFDAFWKCIIVKKSDPEQFKDKKKMVLIIFDDINTLQKGKTKGSGVPRNPDGLHYMKHAGANMLSLLRCIDQKGTCPFVNGVNHLFFAAASQHCNLMPIFKSGVPMLRLEPPTSIAEIGGFCTFLHNAFCQDKKGQKLQTDTIARLVKRLMSEMGMVSRNIIKTMPTVRLESYV